MKNKKVLPEDLLMNTSLDTIAEIIENFPGMCVSTSINLENSIVEANNSFFTNFYNTAAYCFNYALEVMIPLAGNVCEYFRGNTDHYDVECL
ncbi:MAG: hypothetical protein LN567_04055 [Rickettsia endosymbiont of Graphium doson]|nr:hypothetical protein [Rickettsia endosymbiont of Graphium doson]